MSDYRDGTIDTEKEVHRNKTCKHTNTFKSIRNGFYIYTCENTSCKKVFRQKEYKEHLETLISEAKK